jgi:hypothetical protein
MEDLESLLRRAVVIFGRESIRELLPPMSTASENLELTRFRGHSDLEALAFMAIRIRHTG